MGRPRKNSEAIPQEQPATVREMAPATPTPVMQSPAPLAPRQMQIERQGDISAPYSRRFPQVRGGICEFCGVQDPHQPSEMQYKLCQHFRGMQLQCSYCPQGKDADDVINHSNMNIAEHPDKPGMLIAWCDSYECSRKHRARFERNAVT